MAVYRVRSTLLTQVLGLDIPFLLLPFRPTSDPSAARSFVRNFFDEDKELKGERLSQELMLTEPMVCRINFCRRRIC